MVGTARLLLVARTGPLAESLLGLFATLPGVEILGPHSDLLLASLARPEPCLVAVVLDAGQAAEPALGEVRRLRATLPESRCFVLADDVEQLRLATEAGADVVLLKGCRPCELIATVERLLAARPAPDLLEKACPLISAAMPAPKTPKV